jgi:hypothetical protein
MDLRSFEREAKRRGNYCDNRPAAREYCGTCWGMGYHSKLWAYQEYCLGGLEYITGKVLLRHESYTSTVYKIDGKYVSKRAFYAALETFQAPEISVDEQNYIDAVKARQEARAKALEEAARLKAFRRRPATKKGPTLFDVIPA